MDDVVTKTAVILVLAVIAGFATAWFEAYWLALPAALIGFGCRWSSSSSGRSARR